jgi:hypothetical protein
MVVLIAMSSALGALSPATTNITAQTAQSIVCNQRIWSAQRMAAKSLRKNALRDAVG